MGGPSSAQWGRAEHWHYADHMCPLLSISSWSPPERFISPNQAVTCWEKFPFFLNGFLTFNFSASSYCHSFLLYPVLRSLFCLSLSFQPHTVAVSSFQPSSATPTSWLTHFCSKVTDFLGNFQRVVLTPNPLSAPRPPCQRYWLH